MSRGTAFQRTRSGPPRNSTDLVIVMPPNAHARTFAPKRFSSSVLSMGARMRQSTSMLATVDLDNAEWEQRVMNSWPKKCTFVVREILQTERAYIASLEEVILGYMMPLHGYLLSQGEGPNFIHTVFLNVNKLRQLHETLLNRLHSSCGDPHEFSEVFVETDFVQYREYCTNYTDANLFLQKSMAENGKLKMFITQCQHDLDHPLPLHSHLIKPVQRILKYQLMLHELLKYFDEEDIAYPDIKEAMEKMKTVAETINTSFNGEKSDTMASPSVIARKRSKEIKSLQRSRSDQQKQHRTTVADSASEQLQRSMEFEDSLTLLRAVRSRSSKRSERPASSTIGPGKRFRAPIMDLIGFYETPKPTEGFSSDSAPPSSTLPPFPDTTISSSQPSMEDGWVHVTPLSPRQNSPQLSDSPLTSGPSPNASSQTADSCPANSDTKPPTPGKVIDKEESAASKKSPPVLLKTKKEPLSQKKSTPITRSKMETHAKKRNSITLSYELEPEATPLSGKENAARQTSNSPIDLWHMSNQTSKSKDGKAAELKTPIAVPPRPYSPPVVGGSNKPPLPKKPMSPPSVALLPDKPILGHTAHRRRLAYERNRNTHRRVIPGLPQNFVIDVDAEGGPVVSLPPSTPSPAPTRPPSATFFPSMLRPIKNSSMVRTSVFMRHDMLVGELKGGGRQAPPESSSSSAAQMQQNSAKRDAGEGEEGRKVPILPPGLPSNRQRNLKLKRNGALRSSHSTSTPPTTA